MRLGFIGCTHLGPGDKRDDLGPEGGPQARALRVLLRRWRREGIVGVALGDIGDLWQAEEDEIVAAHRFTVEALRRTIKHYIRGNHDRKATENFLGLPPLPYAVIHGVWCEHGDAPDWTVARHPMLCERICRVVGTLERVVHEDVDQWAMQLWYWLSRTGRHAGGNVAYWEPVGRAADDHGCAQAVFVHTHHAGDEWPVIEDGSVYVPVHVHNAGCWIQAWDADRRAWTWRWDSVELEV